MSYDVLIVLVVLSAVQSLFGVGVLLFGTPVLLILGYEFQDALTVLLPVSLAINTLQVAKHWRWINRGFYARILLYTIPLVCVFLYLVTTITINMAMLIGLFVMLIALKNAVPVVDRLVRVGMGYERTFFASMGVVHGLSNLGGSLLTAAVHAKNYPKDAARATTAVSYGTFAAFQILTLSLSPAGLERPLWAHAVYVVVGASVFFLTELLVYAKIDQARYTQLFAVLLFVSGVVLVIKGLV